MLLSFSFGCNSLNLGTLQITRSMPIRLLIYIGYVFRLVVYLRGLVI